MFENHYIEPNIQGHIDQLKAELSRIEQLERGPVRTGEIVRVSRQLRQLSQINRQQARAAREHFLSAQNRSNAWQNRAAS